MPMHRFGHGSAHCTQNCTSRSSALRGHAKKYSTETLKNGEAGVSQQQHGSGSVRGQPAGATPLGSSLQDLQLPLQGLCSEPGSCPQQSSLFAKTLLLHHQGTPSLLFQLFRCRSGEESMPVPSVALRAASAIAALGLHMAGANAAAGYQLPAYADTSSNMLQLEGQRAGALGVSSSPQAGNAWRTTSAPVTNTLQQSAPGASMPAAPATAAPTSGSLQGVDRLSSLLARTGGKLLDDVRQTIPLEARLPVPVIQARMCFEAYQLRPSQVSALSLAPAAVSGPALQALRTQPAPSATLSSSHIHVHAAAAVSSRAHSASVLQGAMHHLHMRSQHAAVHHEHHPVHGLQTWPRPRSAAAMRTHSEQHAHLQQVAETLNMYASSSSNTLRLNADVLHGLAACLSTPMEVPNGPRVAPTVQQLRQLQQNAKDAKGKGTSSGKERRAAARAAAASRLGSTQTGSSTNGVGGNGGAMNGRVNAQGPAAHGSAGSLMPTRTAAPSSAAPAGMGYESAAEVEAEVEPLELEVEPLEVETEPFEVEVEFKYEGTSVGLVQAEEQAQRAARRRQRWLAAQRRRRLAALLGSAQQV